MYLKRKIDDFLIQWKESPRKKPLIVKGPRQIGKTESILHFGRQCYQHVVYINFVEEPKYRSITADGYKAASIIKMISLIDPSKRFEPHETLIIFDELQAFPEIATALKFFQIDGRFDVICSGSMLGINYQKIESNSVGYKMDLELSVFHDLFLDFSILGGMPAVVRDYIEYGTFEGSLDTQRQLLADYNEDIRKYAQGLDQGRILNVFEHIPIQLAKDNKKFQISKVASGARFKDYRGCIEWLRDAGIVNVCYCLNFPELPLKGNYADTKYKLYVADTGLLVAMLDEEAQEDLRAHKNLGVYKGALYENIVAEGLTKSGYALYYFKKASSTLEEDFFVRTSDSLVPIEVKTTNNKSKSLNTLIQSPAYSDIRFGIKLIGGNIGHENDIYTFPYFCTFLVRDFLRQLPPSPAHMV